MPVSSKLTSDNLKKYENLAYCLKSHCGVRGFCAKSQQKTQIILLMYGCIDYLRQKSPLPILVADLRINPFLYFLIIVSKFIPDFEDEALGAVFPVLAYLVVFQHTEGLVEAAFATDIFRV